MVNHDIHRTDIKTALFMLLFITSLFYLPATAHADTNYLQQGIRYYEYGDYDNSLKSLQQINTISETTKTNTLLHLYMSLDYYAKGMNEDMNKELTALYQTDPGFTPNPIIVPPSVISAYNEIKQHTVLPLSVNIREKRQNYWLRAVPFGVGQFSKGEDTKGTILLIAEATELAVNISTYYIRKSEENPDGSYNNVPWARNMQNAQITAFWLLIGTASYGIIDAFVGRSP